jgi:peptidoglycan/LPS O-acetylase OafA/YrhL
MHTTKPFFPHLDGLRFLAFLTVFISHIVVFVFPGKVQFLAQGDLGVSFFFVLSGFLISYLLLVEKDGHGKINLMFFYLRRILRIWPVYYMTLLTGIILACIPFAETLFPISFQLHDLPWYTGFIANFYLVYGDGNTILAVLWSISVEEQFYFFWPLVFSRLQRNVMPLFLSMIIIAATCYRFFHAEAYGNVEYGTLSVMSDLAIGALVGYSMYRYRDIQNYTSTLFSGTGRVIVVYLVLVGMIAVKAYMAHVYPVSAWYVAFEPLIFSVIFAGVIVEQNYSEHSWYKVGRSRIFSYLGKISYGLYAYHMIAIFLVWYVIGGELMSQKIGIVFGSFFLTVFLAHLSYRYIERRILKLKDKNYQAS